MIQRLPAPENCCNGSITKYVIMFRIVEKRLLAPDIWLMNVEAPRVAKAAQPGQFVIVRGTDDGGADTADGCRLRQGAGDNQHRDTGCRCFHP